MGGQGAFTVDISRQMAVFVRLACGAEGRRQLSLGISGGCHSRIEESLPGPTKTSVPESSPAASPFHPVLLDPDRRSYPRLPGLGASRPAAQAAPGQAGMVWIGGGMLLFHIGI